MAKERVYTMRQAAEYLGYTYGSLRVIISRGKGPKGTLINGYNRTFTKAQLDEWKAARMRKG